VSRFGRSGTRARWGWLVTTLALGAALIGTGWTNYQSARRAADDLIRGEAHTMRDAVLATNRPSGEGRRADFDSLVAAHQDLGLRYAGWVRTDGTVVWDGGEAAPVPFAVPTGSTDPVFERLGSRVRAYFPPPRWSPNRERSRGPEPSLAQERRSASEPPASPAPGAPPTILLEFEPVVAAQMMARAQGSLFVAGIVALVLMTAGFGFWRISQRIEATERRMEEHRRLTLLGEMSAVLAHEIRNPLASLKGHAQLLVERLDDGSAERRKAARVVEEATRLESLTSDLLDFARSGPMDLGVVDPGALLEASAAEVSEAIEVDSSESPDHWRLDERRFRQAVLGNILRNAVQASPPDRPPRARVAMENGTLVFTVRDFGAGLPEGEAGQIFEPFFTTRATGTGLGLAVARRIVDLHGGRIAAANAPGGGAVFRVELPRREG
jgi:two-component system sensor histidine kinase HydH